MTGEVAGREVGERTSPAKPEKPRSKEVLSTDQLELPPLAVVLAFLNDSNTEGVMREME